MDINWTEIIITLITLIIAPCLIALTKAGLSYLAAQTEDARLRVVLLDVESAVATAVDSLTQTVVEGLKTASADGKLSAADAQNVLSQALEMAARNITIQTEAYLVEHNTNIREYLIEKIEAAISERKEAI